MPVHIHAESKSSLRALRHLVLPMQHLDMLDQSDLAALHKADLSMFKHGSGSARNMHQV